MKRLAILGAFLGLATFNAGCLGHAGHFHGHLAGHMLGSAVQAAAVGAAILTTAAIITAHDAHFHSEGCGCARQFHEGRWVYWYGGWWEFYEPQGGAWYHY
ncbi:MAG TPA: hypothetical protein VGQ83_10475 [Polyangia bacterium]|jgi:hypothetical protein